MSKNKRRKLTKEFKKKAVKLVMEEGYKIRESAISLGIHKNLLGRWKKEMISDKNSSQGNSSKSREVELKRLKMEREILKKATAFFVKETS